MPAPERTDDTSREVRDLLTARYRSMTVSERMERFTRMQADVEQIAVAGIRSQHPEIDDEHVRYELFRRRYGAALAREVYPQFEA